MDHMDDDTIATMMKEGEEINAGSEQTRKSGTTTTVHPTLEDSDKSLTDTNMDSNPGDASLNRSEPVPSTSIRPKQQIGLLGATAFGMGTIIGSGIFISPTGALRHTGSMGASLLTWTVTGVISMVLGLVYGELGALVPKSGGDFTYIDTGIGQLPAFVAATVQPLVSNMAAVATVSLVLADYLSSALFGDCRPPESFRKLVAATVIVTLGISNSFSVKLSEWTQIVFAIVKFAALCVISVGGIVHLLDGDSALPAKAFEGSNTDVSSYVLAIYSCYFAYGGVNAINQIAEEIIEPKKNIPRAIVLSLFCVTIVYIVTNLSYFIILDKVEFLASDAVAYSWALKAIKPAAIFIPLSVVCSVFGAINSTLFGNVRVLFAASRAGHLPEVMSYLHVRSLIPVFSIGAACSIAVLLVIPADIGQLITFLTSINLIITLLSSISLLLLRRKRDRADTGAFQTPIMIPVLAVVVCLFLIIAPLVLNPTIEFVFGIATAAGSLVLYFPFVYFGRKVPGVDAFTSAIQMLMNICPTEIIDDFEITI